MTRIAQLIASLFVLVLGSAALVSLFSPMTIAGPSGFNPVDNYGLTNIRTLGAPTFVLAAITAFGVWKANWTYIVPAALYFFMNGSARVISVIVEGYEPVMQRGLMATFALFALALVCIYLFRKGDTPAPKEG